MDALELLSLLYKLNLDGKKTNSDDIVESLKWEKQRFSNAYQYLKEKRLVDAESKRMDGIITGISITSGGIDVIEEDDLFKETFGSLKITTHGGPVIFSEAKSHSVSTVSVPTITGNIYKNVGEVHNAPVTNVIHDESKTYEVDTENVKFLEGLSIKLINKFGEKKLLIFDIISGLIGILSGFLGANAFSPTVVIFVWLPKLPQDFAMPLIILALVLLGLAGIVYSLVEYKYESKCPKCKKFYALEEVGQPTVREVDVKGGTRRTTTRTYRCRSCGHTEPRKKNKFIPDEAPPEQDS